MIHLRHILHPIHSVKSLYRKVSLYVYRHLAERQFRSIRRGKRGRCWCGGELMPFKWHSSYGVCAECGCYVNKYPPLPDEFKKIYSSDCYWGSVSRMRGWPILSERAALYKTDGRLNHWLRLIEKYGASHGTVIEIGCAPGILLSELQLWGYKCVGVEIEKKVVHWIQQNLNLDIRQGIFPDDNLRLPKCDLFLAFDVLEHTPSPDKFMKEVSSLLKPGGIAIIQTAIDQYDYKPPFGRRFKDAFNDIEHLFLFTDEAMRELAKLSGLEVISSNEGIWLMGEIYVFKKSEFQMSEE